MARISTKSSKRVSRARDTSRWRSNRPNALTLLREDHARVSKLFADFERRKDRLGSDEKQELANRICLELTIHAQIEEELFYPALRETLRSHSGSDLLDEAEVEHASVKDLIAQIEQHSPESELYDAKVKVLGEYVRHHVKEEQSEIFQLARKAKLDLKALGEQMAERKQQFQQPMRSAA